MPCIDEKTIWSAQLTLTHIAPLTSLFVGCVGSCRRAFRLWERNRLAQLVHMAKQRAGGAPATWPRRGAHLLRPRLPAASAASSRASASPHRTTVLAVLLPAHSAATRRSLAGRAQGGRGQGTPSASARGQRSTTSAWIAPACVVSVVWRYRRPQGGQGNAELPGPRKQDDEATAAHKGPAAIVSSRRKILACGMRRSSEQGT